MAPALGPAPLAKPKSRKHITGQFAVKETNGSQKRKDKVSGTVTWNHKESKKPEAIRSKARRSLRPFSANFAI